MKRFPCTLAVVFLSCIVCLAETTFIRTKGGPNWSYQGGKDQIKTCRTELERLKALRVEAERAGDAEKVDRLVPEIQNARNEMDAAQLEWNSKYREQNLIRMVHSSAYYEGLGFWIYSEELARGIFDEKTLFVPEDKSCLDDQELEQQLRLTARQITALVQSVQDDVCAVQPDLSSLRDKRDRAFRHFNQRLVVTAGETFTDWTESDGSIENTLLLYQIIGAEKRRSVVDVYTEEWCEKNDKVTALSNKFTAGCRDAVFEKIEQYQPRLECLQELYLNWAALRCEWVLRKYRRGVEMTYLLF